jgi:hypothetical protein
MCRYGWLKSSGNTGDIEGLPGCVVLLTPSYVAKFDTHGSVHHDIITKITNKMQLCRLIYCSLAALNVSSDIFAHHQEYLNCIYSFCYYSLMSLPAEPAPT